MTIDQLFPRGKFSNVESTDMHILDVAHRCIARHFDSGEQYVISYFRAHMVAPFFGETISDLISRQDDRLVIKRKLGKRGIIHLECEPEMYGRDFMPDEIYLKLAHGQGVADSSAPCVGIIKEGTGSRIGIVSLGQPVSVYSSLQG